MKALLSIGMVAALTTLGLAQYNIDWHKVAAGGGTSTNGQYSLTGTIGQHDASLPMTNGTYSLTGGFWVLPSAVQTTGAPLLTIAPASPWAVTISWAPNTPGYSLQTNATLTPAGWGAAPSGSTNPIVVSTAGAAKFYRLVKP